MRKREKKRGKNQYWTEDKLLGTSTLSLLIFFSLLILWKNCLELLWLFSVIVIWEEYEDFAVSIDACISRLNQTSTNKNFDTN